MFEFNGRTLETAQDVRDLIETLQAYGDTANLPLQERLNLENMLACLPDLEEHLETKESGRHAVGTEKAVSATAPPPAEAAWLPFVGQGSRV